MAKTWLQIRVDLESGGGADLDPPPGRIFLVGPTRPIRGRSSGGRRLPRRWRPGAGAGSRISTGASAAKTSS